MSRDEEILRIGRQMSNVCWNLGQHPEAVDIKGSQSIYADLARQWDAAVNQYLNDKADIDPDWEREER